MLGVAIDALVLMVLLSLINNEEVSFLTAFVVALVTSIGATILAVVLASFMGVAGLFVAGGIAAALLGIAVSALFGTEIKRSFLIGGIFMLVHVGRGVAFSLLFSL